MKMLKQDTQLIRIRHHARCILTDIEGLPIENFIKHDLESIIELTSQNKPSVK